MKDASICLKPINDLLTDDQGQPTQFWIPAYQRGYRWTPLQVTQLLDDVWEFIQGSEEGSRQAFYCLQPLVLKAREGGDFEVVDGQQRLTTIYILLTYMKEIVELLGKGRFQIRFETRGEANEPFLESIDLDRAEENVDFYYICQAYRAIDDWFADRDSSHKLKLLQHLLNDDEAGRNVKVIWFELADSDNPVDAFTRLNVGKIPLTNDELVRALFLKSSGNDEADSLASQLKIAYEWDQLEKALQSDAFWYFLNNEAGARQNRIGFLFELVTKNNGLPDSAGYGEYRVFYEYNKKLKDEGVAPEDEWLKIKQAYMTLEEWFEDRRLYHVIGFLIQQGLYVDKIQALSMQITKSCFEQKLREKIYAQVIGGDALETLSANKVKEHVSDTLDDLEYDVDSDEIRAILLLFNLATLLEDPRSNIRFQFDSFKNGDWDIEHVRSVASSRPVRHNERMKWLELCLGYLMAGHLQVVSWTPELQTEIETFIQLSQSEADEIDFDVLYEGVLACFKEGDDEDVDDGIANLALLDSHTNRSYKNAVFAIKRERLLELDQSGIFVPLCTRNVFLKCYSPRVDNVMFWGEEDRNGYRSVMIGTLTRFFTGEQVVTDE